MPFCAKCGTNVTGTFCPNCGLPVSASPDPSQGSAPPPQFQQQPGAQPAAGLSENAANALCYLLGLITGVIFLVMAPYNTNPRTKFHAWQSIFFNLAWIALWMVLWIVTMILTYAISFLGLLLIPVQLLIWLAGFLSWLFLMYKAYQGEQFEIPVIGPMARQQANK